jgi:hypothetical protein
MIAEQLFPTSPGLSVHPPDEPTDDSPGSHKVGWIVFGIITAIVIFIMIVAAIRVRYRSLRNKRQHEQHLRSQHELEAQNPRRSMFAPVVGTGVEAFLDIRPPPPAHLPGGCEL